MTSPTKNLKEKLTELLELHVNGETTRQQMLPDLESLLSSELSLAVKGLRESLEQDEETPWAKIAERFKFTLNNDSKDGFVAGLDCAYSSFDAKAKEILGESS